MAMPSGGWQVARGGRRRSAPGNPNPNRTDANRALPVQTAPSEQFGERAEQRRSQQAVPLAPPEAGQGPPPGAAGPFTRPTERPQEPITAGSPMGAGPGPEAIPLPDPSQDVSARLRALYMAHPTTELAELLEEMDLGR